MKLTLITSFLFIKTLVFGQDNTSKITDKITNIFRQIIANPQGFIESMKIPGMSEAFSQLLEGSGMSPLSAEFSAFTSAQPPPVPSPMQDLPKLQTTT